MGADITRLQGLVLDTSEETHADGDIERLIAGLLRSLLEEQKLGRDSETPNSTT